MARILHVLDHSLPLHSGYSFRTRAIMKAQERSGWAVAGLTGLRQSTGTGQYDPDASAGLDAQEHEGLRFLHLLHRCCSIDAELVNQGTYACA